MTTYDPENPLARYTGETRKANDALNTYFGMGPGRSLRKLERKYQESTTKTRFTTIKRWSSKYHWQARVDAQSELDNAADREYWAEQRRQIRQADLKAAIALRDRAERMRAFPVARQVVERYKDGREKTVVMPTSWREADIARIETTASDLARRAAEMAKERTDVDVKSGGKPIQLIGIDPDGRDED